ncbi:MAG TPA: coenzyme F420-0:L-glutamate ligase [Ktedonobacterales bacterium]|nr:coenzyme F420-0:L-glutamate ligase [Ktedonobacterales bacterium]
MELRIIPVRGIGEVKPGDDLAGAILAAIEQQGEALAERDIVVVTQKIVSKAEGQMVDPATIEPSAFAQEIAQTARKDAHHQEVVLRQSRRIVRMDRGVLITETKHGLICANAGVDESNVGGGHLLTLLPEDPDASAAGLRSAFAERTGADVAVIISDTWGRPWRTGQVNFAIGVAGMNPLQDYIGKHDPYGYELHVSLIAVADELASAAELVMGKIDRVPVAIIRGYEYTPAEGRASSLIRDSASDLFR